MGAEKAGGNHWLGKLKAGEGWPVFSGGKFMWNGIWVGFRELGGGVESKVNLVKLEKNHKTISLSLLSNNCPKIIKSKKPLNYYIK